MTKLQKISLAAALVLAILAAFNQAKRAHIAVQEEQKLREQQAQSAKQIIDLKDSLADKNNELAELLAENSRLKNNSNETELLKLRGEVTRLRPLQNDVVALQEKLRQSSAGLPTWKTNEIANVGRATPVDALQTYIYSSQNTNMAEIQNSIVGDDVDPPSAEALRNFINDENNHSLGNEGVSGYKILSETWLTPDKVEVELGVSTSHQIGMSAPLVFRNVNGEWKLVVFNVRDADGKFNHLGFVNESPGQ